jgi:hypothetical protein
VGEYEGMRKGWRECSEMVVLESVCMRECECVIENEKGFESEL